MNYIGFGNQDLNSFRKPRRVFKPIFEQLANGEHPIESNNRSFFKTWKETQILSDEEDFRDRIRTKMIYLTIYMTVLGSLLVTAI